MRRQVSRGETMTQSIKQAGGYGLVAKTLHWLIVVLLAAQYAVGSIMPHIGRGTTDDGYVAWHISIGAAILFFIVLRLAWRLTHAVPQLATIALWQQRAAEAVHWSLYGLILIMALLGWAATSFRGWPVKLFGMVTLPPLANTGDQWAHTAGDIHDLLVYVLLAFIVVHVGAALYHHFILRDRVLRRMLPGA